MAKLLIIDDEPNILRSLSRAFAAHNLEILTAESLAEARIGLRERPNVVVTDLNLPDGNGLDLLDGLDADVPLIVITGRGSTETAIEAMKRGAFEYLLKPLDHQNANRVVAMAIEANLARSSGDRIPRTPARERIVGSSPPIQEMCKLIGRIAVQDVNVLIRGESGTGKELVARAVYEHSRRAEKPFLAINCAALPESLVESELFGHEQGAFTGASRQRIGRFEQADGGTLLLDEIGDMTLSVQAKMLRVLQNQTFERVGGSRSLTTRVRILAATHRNLDQMVAEGLFRADLYYRLKTISIQIPPLRVRLSDLPLLAEYFLDQISNELGRDSIRLSNDALPLLESHSWPGNVREFQGVLRAAALRSSSHLLRPDDLLPSLAPPPSNATALPTIPAECPSRGHSESLAEFIESAIRTRTERIHEAVMKQTERELVARVLRYTSGHQAKASVLLGITRATLRSKIREHGILLDKVVSTKPSAPLEP